MSAKGGHGVLAEMFRRQFGAALAMLENAIAACPEELWRDRSRKPEFWYVAYHALFFLDFYLTDSEEGFAPPAPFTLAELDPAGVLPERPYTKAELLSYLEHGRAKCRALIAALTEENARERRRMLSFDGSLAELLLYNLRHVQHHAGQLNLILRQDTNDAPRYVGERDLFHN
jgi:DinB family protein